MKFFFFLQAESLENHPESPKSNISDESLRQYQIFIFHMANTRFKWSHLFHESEIWTREIFSEFQSFLISCSRTKKIREIQIEDKFMSLLEEENNSFKLLLDRFCEYFLQPFYKIKMVRVHKNFSIVFGERYCFFFFSFFRKKLNSRNVYIWQHFDPKKPQNVYIW